MKKHATSGILLSGLTLLAAGLSAGVSSAETVKIGFAAPLTGGIAHLGKDTENGALLAVEEINAKGLVIGKTPVTLELDTEDDAADPRTATQVAQKMVDDGVVAIVGHLNSGTSIPASKIYFDAGVAQISPGATNPAYTLQGFRTAFRLVATDAQQGPALARYAVSHLKIRTVAIVDDSTAYGQGLANEFAKTASASGVNVLSRDASSDKAIDFRAILTKIKAENPDAIMYGGNDATGGPFAKQARQLGIKARILAGDGLCTENLADVAGDSTDNILCSTAGAALDKMPGGAQFSKSFEARFHGPVLLDAPYAYDAVYIIVAAMQRTQSTARNKILDAMPATRYQGVTGETVFDAHGDQKHGVITLYEYKQGKKQFLDSVTM